MTISRGFSLNSWNDRVTRRCSGVISMSPQRLALFQSVLHRQQRLQFGLMIFPIGTRLLDGVLEAFDTTRHDVQVGDQQVLFEALQVRGRIVAVEGGHDDHQAAGLANHRQPCGTPFVRAAQPGRVDHLQRGQRDFLGMVDLAQIMHARFGNHRHRGLGLVDQDRIGRFARQPVKQRTLARALIADDSDFHACHSTRGGDASDSVTLRPDHTERPAGEPFPVTAGGRCRPADRSRSSCSSCAVTAASCCGSSVQSPNRTW